ncbi:lactate permease [Marininema mesophilum]|uniref:L-lactate permease n=1 Tax=Marininema mesophilum TaxID=1048340 RepID=A0A1H2VNE2_9BACL|nr:L-lactate permease [Marininema mesophilum]SDW69780.1 lactate permease [Marininema mesophilum]
MVDFFLAISPIVAVLIILFVLRQSIVRAGIAGCLLALVIAISYFKLKSDEVLFPFIKGTLTTSSVAYFLLFGIFLFHLMNERGVIRSFAAIVAKSTHDPVRQVLILAVAFSPLVESASGFGLAAIVICPILIALGFRPVQAIIISLISLSAVPWGSLAAGTVIGSDLAHLDPQNLGTGTALLSLPIFAYFAIIMTIIADGWKGLKRRWFEVLLTSGTLGLSVWAFNAFVGVELAGVFGALSTLGVELAVIRFVTRREVDQQAESEIGAALAQEENFGKLKSLSPYLFLIGMLLFSRLVPGVAEVLKTHAVLSLPTYQFTFPFLYSPGFFLILVCIFTIWIFGIKQETITKSMKQTWIHWYPVIVSTLLFVIMSEMMSLSGMTQVLSQTAAETFGSAFLYITPLIGGLGGFLAGSNTGSNSMFIKMQVQTAHQLGLSEQLAAYSQNASSSHLIMANPSKVVLGASIGGVREQESALLKRMLLVGFGTVTIIGIELVVIRIVGWM